jgi:hypothetical protein
MANVSKRFTYTGEYRCNKCGQNSVAVKFYSDEPALTDSGVRAVTDLADQWCETPNCGWHGPVAGLQFVRKYQNDWRP